MTGSPPPERAIDVALQKTAADVAVRFAFLSEEAFGGEHALLRNLRDYSSPEFVQRVLADMVRDGLVQAAPDALDALRAVATEIVALRVIDLTGAQIARLQGRGTLDQKDAYTLQKLADALGRVNKIALEIKEAAGFSRKSRWEMGHMQGGGFQQLLEDVMGGTGIAEAEDMTSLIVGKVAKVVRVDDAQVTIEDAAEREGLTPAELVELVAP